MAVLLIKYSLNTNFTYILWAIVKIKKNQTSNFKNFWSKGRVIEIYPGSNGIVKKTKGNV